MASTAYHNFKFLEDRPNGFLYQSICVLTAAVAGWHRASLTHLTSDGMPVKHTNHTLIWTFKSNSDGLNGQLPQLPS